MNFLGLCIIGSNMVLSVLSTQYANQFENGNGLTKNS